VGGGVVVPPPSSPPPPPPPVEAGVMDARPMPTELKLDPPLIAKVAAPALPPLVIVRVPVDRVELLVVVVVSCTSRTILLLELLVTLVAFHVPLATIIAPVMGAPPSLPRDWDLKRVK